MEIECGNCGAKNKSTNIKCENCGIVIDDFFEQQQLEEIKKQVFEAKYQPKNEESVKNIIIKDSSVLTKVIFIIFTFPFIFAGLISVIMSTLFFINDNIAVKDYEKTEGILIQYTGHGESSSGDNFCKGVYKYTIDNKIYEIETTYYSDKSNFKQETKVMYNPSNPKEAVVIDRWYSPMFIVGSILLIFVMVIYIFICKALKKSESKKEKSNAITYK